MSHFENLSKKICLLENLEFAVIYIKLCQPQLYLVFNVWTWCYLRKSLTAFAHVLWINLWIFILLLQQTRRCFLGFPCFLFNLGCWLLGFRKLMSSEKVEILQVVLVLRLCDLPIFFQGGKKRCFFPYLHHEIIFCCAELFECVFNFKLC